MACFFFHTWESSYDGCQCKDCGKVKNHRFPDTADEVHSRPIYGDATDYRMKRPIGQKKWVTVQCKDCGQHRSFDLR